MNKVFVFIKKKIIIIIIYHYLQIDQLLENRARGTAVVKNRKRAVP